MDSLKHAFYEAKFRLHYLEKRGNAFQDMFSEIMERCHPADFLRVRPWGSEGDRKNDGYLCSKRALFQVYAPDTMTASKAVSKLNTDFKDALPYWRAYFDTWVFVHNSISGLAPRVVKTLLNLGKRHRYLTISSWGYPELRGKVFSLGEADLAELLGTAPSDKDLMDVRFSDVQDVIAAIAAHPAPREQDIRPVPSSKLAYNRLAEDVEELIRGGMRKAHLVEQFFNQWPDPQYGDRVAAAFRQKYIACRNLQMSTDDIFYHLQLFAGG